MIKLVLSYIYSVSFKVERNSNIRPILSFELVLSNVNRTERTDYAIIAVRNLLQSRL